MKSSILLLPLLAVSASAASIAHLLPRNSDGLAVPQAAQSLAGATAHVAAAHRRSASFSRSHNTPRMVRVRRGKKDKKKGSKCKPKGGSSSDGAPSPTSPAGSSSETGKPSTDGSSNKDSSTENKDSSKGESSTGSPSPSASDSKPSDGASKSEGSPTSSGSTPEKSDNAAPGGSDKGGNSGGVNTNALFPIQAKNFWTTCPDHSNGLTMDGIERIAGTDKPTLEDGPDGGKAYKVKYEAGGFGGASKKYPSGKPPMGFYASGNYEGVDVTTANEAVFSYAVYFPDNFDFKKGGKLPGLFGGTDFDSAKSCSGGRQEGRDACFSTRLMWRSNGDGEIYDYLPLGQTYSCEDPNICNPKFGDSIGRGKYQFQKGAWTVVAHRVKLNDAGQSNGEQELFVNGESKIKLDGLKLRTSDQTKFQGFMSETFFGGGDKSFAPDSDQEAWFKDYTVTILN